MVKVLFCATWPKISTGYAKIANLLSNKLASHEDTEVHYLAFQSYADDIDRFVHPRINFIKSKEFGDDILEEILTKTVKPDIVILYNDVIVGSRFVNIMLKIEKSFKFIMYIDLTYKWQRYIDHLFKKVDMFVCFHKTWMNHLIEMGVPAHQVTYLDHPIDRHFSVIDTVQSKEQWNFDGFVVSDWGSIEEMVEHGYAEDAKQAAQIAVEAGSDMDMQSLAYVDHLTDLVKSGVVKQALIDDAVRRILRVKFELGLFDDPYKYCNIEREKATIGHEKFQEATLEMAKKSIVLLKNQNQLLPLKKKGLNIALIGDLADDKTSPLGIINLTRAATEKVSILPRDLCARKYTFELSVNENDSSQDIR